MRHNYTLFEIITIECPYCNHKHNLMQYYIEFSPANLAYILHCPTCFCVFEAFFEDIYA